MLPLVILTGMTLIIAYLGFRYGRGILTGNGSPIKTRPLSRSGVLFLSLFPLTLGLFETEYFIVDVEFKHLFFATLGWGLACWFWWRSFQL